MTKLVPIFSNAWQNTGQPLPASIRPQLWYRPVRASLDESTLLAGVEVQATIDMSTGAAVAQVVASPGLRYRPLLRWLTNPLEPKPERWAWGEAEWGFTVDPWPNGGRLEDLVGADDLGAPWIVSLTPPPAAYRGLYLNAAGEGYWPGVPDDPESSGTGDLFRCTSKGLILLGNLRGPRGRDGKDGLSAPDALPADAAVGEYAAAKTSNTYAGIASGFLADDAAAMNERKLYTGGDSFGQIIAPATTSWPLELADDRDMDLNNQNVSSSFDRDVAMRMNPAPPMLSGNDFIVLNGGVNPAHIYGTDGLTRQAEKAALMSAILLAVAGSKLEHNVAGETGTWTDYVNEALSGGSGRTSVVPESTLQWTPTWGDYFALAFTYRAAVGATGNSGEWKIGSNVLLAARTTAPPQTPLEASAFSQSARNFVPWPVMAPSLDGSNAVRLTAKGPGITTADALWKIADNPPVVAVLIPGYTNPAGSLFTPNATIDVYRGDRLAAIAEITKTYPRLRGRVIPVDPMLFGWNPLIHTTGDGLHPNNDGHKLLALAVQRTVARALMLAPLMPTWGVAGPGYPTEWPWG